MVGSGFGAGKIIDVCFCFHEFRLLVVLLIPFACFSLFANIVVVLRCFACVFAMGWN